MTILGKTYKPLGDGAYDAVFFSTGLKECILAGLLAVRGWKVLQMDRNPYYGGACASLNLEELYKQYGKPYDAKAVEGKFGAPRKYSVDLVPKFLMANGKIVKMLVQTGVTRYMEFNGIAGSYVVAQSMFSGASVYRVPVTPAEALKSTLVGMVQKRSLVSFATWLDKYRASERAADAGDAADALSADAFRELIERYYAVHNPDKKGEVGTLLEQFKSKPRAQLVSALERKYAMPLFPEESDAEFGPGSLGLRIDPRKFEPGGSALLKSVVRVHGFQSNADGSPGQGERSGKVRVGDWISKVGGESVLGLTDAEVTNRLVQSPRPVVVTFVRPPAHERPSVGAGAGAGAAAAPSASNAELNAKDLTMAQVYAHFGLDENSQAFIGHAMALETSDAYVGKPAEPTLEKIQLYGKSVGRYGQNSPYLYPLYGLSSLPEGFSRLAAIYGGTVMLRTAPDEILRDEKGHVVGVRVGEEAASAKVVVGDASYFPKERSRVSKRVVRSICLLKHPVSNTSGEHSFQIIIPAKEVKGRVHDLYVSCISSFHQVSPPGMFVCICSTVAETPNPVAELQPAFNLLGAIDERFDSVVDVMASVDAAQDTRDGMVVLESLDETSHFESATDDILTVYRRVFGKPLDLTEKLVPDQPQE